MRVKRFFGGPLGGRAAVAVGISQICKYGNAYVNIMWIVKLFSSLSLDPEVQHIHELLFALLARAVVKMKANLWDGRHRRAEESSVIVDCWPTVHKIRIWASMYEPTARARQNFEIVLVSSLDTSTIAQYPNHFQRRGFFQRLM
jgi:hypothetical protein